MFARIVVSRDNQNFFVNKAPNVSFTCLDSRVPPLTHQSLVMSGLTRWRPVDVIISSHTATINIVVKTMLQSRKRHGPEAIEHEDYNRFRRIFTLVC